MSAMPIGKRFGAFVLTFFQVRDARRMQQGQQRSTRESMRASVSFPNWIIPPEPKSRIVDVIRRYRSLTTGACNCKYSSCTQIECIQGSSPMTWPTSIFANGYGTPSKRSTAAITNDFPDTSQTVCEFAVPHRPADSAGHPQASQYRQFSCGYFRAVWSTGVNQAIAFI